MLKRMVSTASRLLVRTGLLRNLVIIRMDGGICSQMHFYLVGKLLEARGNRIRFDLRWYKECGLDLDGKQTRNFDLLRLFPNLDFETAYNNLERRLYISSFYKYLDYFKEDSSPSDWLGIKGPVYIAGYFKDPENMYGDFFHETFRVDAGNLDDENRKLFDEIRESPEETCAIHIRRGDLAAYNKAYGEPVTTAYFAEAVKAIEKELGGKPGRYYLFSDEPDWCRENVIPVLPASGNVLLLSHNGADKGYMDLALMSQCRHIITSQGSMGKYAALLREERNRDGLVVLPPNFTSDEWKGRFGRSVVPAPVDNLHK